MVERVLVEPDLGVGQVVVVDQHQVRPRPADQLAAPAYVAPLMSSSTRVVRTSGVALQVVAADAEPVRAQHVVVGRRGLLDDARS